MALLPNKHTWQTFSEYDAPDEFSEAVASVTVKCGWYQSPALSEPILIEKTTIIRNHYGQINRQDDEDWSYRRAGAPPSEYTRETRGRFYLPKVSGLTFGSEPVLLERVREEFWPWSLFQPGSPNLSRHRTVSGWVVYDMRSTDNPLTQEERDELAARNRRNEGDGNLIVDSARPWHEAAKFGEIIRDADAPQVAVWREPYESASELVFEEPDRFSIFTITKNHLRDGPAALEGPSYQRKEDFNYRLPVPILPPEIEATELLDGGVGLEVTGGGAEVRVHIAPERYRIERKTISEADKDTNADPWTLYIGTPPSSTPAVGVEETDVTDLGGTPASSTPADSGHTETGDDSEPDPDGWLVVAELQNDADPADEGHATTTDTDVVNLGVYVYRAVAIIGSEESAPSSPERVSYGGATTGGQISIRGRNTGDGAAEVDALAPSDLDLPLEYGETATFDLPVLVDTMDEALELGEELARRQFAEAEPGLELELVTTEPLAILERGQTIITPAVEWSTTGNGLVITSETEERAWRLDGFRLAARRGIDGSLDLGSVLYLVE